MKMTISHKCGVSNRCEVSSGCEVLSRCEVLHKRKVAGFTLLEVMVTVVILALGMMGLGALIIRGQQSTREAFERQSALFYTKFMAEKIRANLAAPGHAPIAAGGTPTLALRNAAYDAAVDVGNGNFKGGTTVAENDLQQWDLLLRGGLKTTDTPAGGAALQIAPPPVRGCIIDVTTTLGNIPKLVGDQPWINQPEKIPVATKILQIFQVSVVWQAPASATGNPANLGACAGMVTGFDKGKNAPPLREISILVTKY